MMPANSFVEELKKIGSKQDVSRWPSNVFFQIGCVWLEFGRS